MTGVLRIPILPGRRNKFRMPKVPDNLVFGSSDFELPEWVDLLFDTAGTCSVSVIPRCISIFSIPSYLRIT